MSEEKTKDHDGARSFEDRIFARFDALDERLNSMDRRLDAVDERLVDMNVRLEKLEAKQYDTKPIWERALAEITEVKEELRRGFRVLNSDLFNIRTEQQRTEERLAKLEPHS